MQLDGQLAYIGVFITAANYRGKGIGTVVLKQVLNTLQGRNIILDSVPVRQDFYRKHGFQSSNTVLSLIRATVKPLIDFEDPAKIQIQPIGETNIDAVLKYDMSVSLIDRSDHLVDWVMPISGQSLAAFREGVCVGYICVRYEDGRNIHRVQPLYADTPHIARALMQKCLISCLTTESSSLNIRMNIASGNQEGSQALVQQFGDVETSVCGCRMHSIQEVEVPWRKVFSIVNKYNTII